MIRHSLASKRAVIALLLSGVATLTHAQEADAPVLLDTIVITATQGERSQRDAPATISVVDGAALRQKPINDLSDALAGTPGVTLDGVGMGNRGISLRGMNSDHTLVLVDGARISTSSSAVAHSDYEHGWVPSAAIDRVEVVRGPMSSLYGSEALGGVVNVITRRPGDVWAGAVSANVTAPRDGGDQRAASIYADGPLVPGTLGLSLWAEQRRRDAMRSEREPGRTELGQQDATTAGLGLVWTPDDRQTVDLSLGYGREKRWHDVVSGPSSYRSEDDIRRNRVSLSHEGDWDWAETRLRLTRTDIERTNQRSDGMPAGGPNRLIDTMLDGQIVTTPLDGHRLTLGAEVRDERLKDPTVNAAGREDATHYAVFLQDEIALGDRLELVFGTRFDRHEVFGWETSPRAYLVWHASDALTVKGGIGKGFRAPTLKELSPEYRATAGGGRFTVIGNPDLEPETSVSAELGVDYAGTGWNANATVFQNDVDNLIQSGCVVNCTNGLPQTWTYSNVDEVRIRGLELGGDIELRPDLILRASYGYLDAIDRGTGEQLTGRPRHSGTVDLEWQPVDRFSATLSLRHVGTQKSTTGTGTAPSYTMVSAYGDYAVSEAASLQFGIENLTDERLALEDEAYKFADPGRRIFAGLTARF
ncbi:TonB-dependent receptor [Paracoccus caeni]|uniref:TonB-dependent receptor n=1 Tax=Paracoccus caeni TaxID=657651 RepID=A0A934SCX4_9RHOB|nr:TonB-dependent receptor [Paracoccus caeni]MBK4215035.1 TonB-dependent receptor [Paracoccus caeni]